MSETTIEDIKTKGRTADKQNMYEKTDYVIFVPLLQQFIEVLAEVTWLWQRSLFKN